jgi:probable phosphoglycerate mutase
VPELYLVRHAVNDYVKTGRLAGWTPDVHLNAEGKAQAAALGERLAQTQIDALYSSPLERCQETAQAILAHHPDLTLNIMEEIGEVRYGLWQGAEISKLATRKMWRAVQINPTRATFPGGETMREAQLRFVNALETLAERHPRSRIVVCSHADLIKMAVAHYIGVHLDLFQRIEISPASLTILRLNFGRPMVVQVNETSYLPKVKPPEPDTREITEIVPPLSATIDAIGEPGNRVFYMQIVGVEELSTPPVTFALEKTQASMIAARLAELTAPYAEVPPADLPALTAPEKVLFRIGRFTLEYDSEREIIDLTLEEMLGEGQGTPRRVHIPITLAQAKALSTHADAVVRRGRA